MLAVHEPLNALTKDFHVLDFRFGVGLPKPLFRVLGGFGQNLVVEHRDGLVERRVGHAEFEVEPCAPRPLVPVQPERYFHAGQLELWVALRATVGIDVHVLPPHGILLWRFDEDVVEVEVGPDGCAHGGVRFGFLESDRLKLKERGGLLLFFLFFFSQGLFGHRLNAPTPRDFSARTKKTYVPTQDASTALVISCR